jgi:hypothetical protein
MISYSSKITVFIATHLRILVTHKYVATPGLRNTGLRYQNYLARIRLSKAPLLKFENVSDCRTTIAEPDRVAMRRPPPTVPRRRLDS